jgi:hypothetical protein
VHIFPLCFAPCMCEWFQGVSGTSRCCAEILNYSLQANAGLTYADNTPAHMAATTKVAIQEARKMLAAMGALYQVQPIPYFPFSVCTYLLSETTVLLPVIVRKLGHRQIPSLAYQAVLMCFCRWRARVLAC